MRTTDSSSSRGRSRNKYSASALLSLIKPHNDPSLPHESSTPSKRRLQETPSLPEIHFHDNGVTSDLMYEKLQDVRSPRQPDHIDSHFQSANEHNHATRAPEMAAHNVPNLARPRAARSWSTKLRSQISKQALIPEEPTPQSWDQQNDSPSTAQKPQPMRLYLTGYESDVRLIARENDDYTLEVDNSTPRSTSRSIRLKAGPSSHVDPTSAVRSRDEVFSFALPTLPPLQHIQRTNKGEHPKRPAEDDPTSWLLLKPGDPSEAPCQLAEHVLEQRAELLYGSRHLSIILENPSFVQAFAKFLTKRPNGLQSLHDWLSATKAWHGLKYVNGIIKSMTDDPASTEPGVTLKSDLLEARRTQSFNELLNELPAFIAFQWIKVTSLSARYRINRSLPAHLREASKGLAEVFCITDPTRPDNPIVMVSEEFQQTTQYCIPYAINRNCRFLQGPQTDKASIARIKEACNGGRSHTEVLLNYRRDGTPFMNLLMLSPLRDPEGTLRYFLGAQIDVSGLLLSSCQLDAFAKLVQEENVKDDSAMPSKPDFQAFCELLNAGELNMVRQYGGQLHCQTSGELGDIKPAISSAERLIITDPEPATGLLAETAGRSNTSTDTDISSLPEVYEKYLLLRPSPSLRILFTSVALSAVPLQSPFLDHIGGAQWVRDDISNALSKGQGVSARVRWLPGFDNGQTDAKTPTEHYWIHCTSLLDQNGEVGVWVVILVKEEA